MGVIHLPSEPDVLLVEANFPSTEPTTVFAYWTESALLHVGSQLIATCAIDRVPHIGCVRQAGQARGPHVHPLAPTTSVQSSIANGRKGGEGCE